MSANIKPMSQEDALKLCLASGIVQPKADGAGYELTADYQHDEAKGPLPGCFYQHQDGGIYRFLQSAKSTENLEQLYIYEHVWPFEAGQVWARPAHEWASRFVRIRFADLVTVMNQDPAQAQQDVIAAKAARRAKEGKAQ